jgi:hypothetical protein
VLRCSKDGDLTLLHACAKVETMPAQISLRLLALGANPNALSVVRLSDARSAAGPMFKRMDVLASAIYHRAWKTQLALLTCSRLQFLNRGADVQWYEDGHSDEQEVAGAWPTQQENQAAGEKQSMWWSDMLDAAFRYIFLAREYHLQLASGLTLLRMKAATSIGSQSLLAFVESKLTQLQPDVLMLAYMLATKSFDDAKDYAHGRSAGKELSNAVMAKAILKRVKVSQNQRAFGLAKPQNKWICR